jgi:hypothetical protein
MTQDDVIEIARQADIDYHRLWNDDGSNRLEAFAKLIAAKEREECADFLEHGVIDDEGHHLQYAKEIRARGEQA